jgi:hypothetical protein
MPPLLSSYPETSIDSPIDVLIVGGGLSGVTVAWKLSQLSFFHSSSSNTSKKKWHLLEAQSTLGGRLQNDNAGYNIDMGGAWVWPEHQPHMAFLLHEFDLETMLQPEDVDRDGRVRVCGGARAIVDCLEKSIVAGLDGKGEGSRSGVISLEASVVACTRVEGKDVVQVTFVHAGDASTSASDECTAEANLQQQQHSIYTRHLVWTAPPRKSLPSSIDWNPPLSPSKIQAQQHTNTWMASITKVAFVYERKHWDTMWIRKVKEGLYLGRRRGLELEVFDVYDASTLEDGGDEEDGDGVAAFTVFALVSSEHDNDSDKVVARRIMNQLLSVAPQSSSSWLSSNKHSMVHHWPHVKSISDNPRPKEVGDHPHPQRALAQGEWPMIANNNDGKAMMVHFAGTESDLSSSGVMEGAVGAAYRVVDELKCIWSV